MMYKLSQKMRPHKKIPSSLLNSLLLFPRLYLHDVCNHGSFVKDDRKMDDLSLGGLGLNELKLEKPTYNSKKTSVNNIQRQTDRQTDRMI